MGNYASIALNPDGAEVTYRWPICKTVSQVRTILSYVVVILTWICAFNSLGGVFTTAIGVYLLLFCFPLTALEFSKILMMCCTICPEEGKFCQFWHFILRLDGWKRGVFYIIVSLPMFIPGFTHGFAILVALLLLILGLLYVATKFTVVAVTIPPPTIFPQGGPAAYSPNAPQQGQQPGLTPVAPYNY